MSNTVELSSLEQLKKFASKIARLSKEDKPKKLTGYNIFSRDNRSLIDGDSKEKMKILGAMWKELSDKQKAKWNLKATTINTDAITAFQYGDQDIAELKKRIADVLKEWKSEVLPRKTSNKSTKSKISVIDSDDSDSASPLKTSNHIDSDYDSECESD
jgi:hypothetical protein